MSNTIAGQYSTTLPSLTNRDQAPVQLDANGRLLTSSSSVGGGVTYTDLTITSATGSSETLAAANAGRKSLLIKAGASQVGVNLLGGTAAIGGAETLTLQPYEALFLSGADCPVGAITVISTAAAYVSAFEGA